MTIESIFRPDLLKNDVALVTGGGTGIGYRVAEELGQLGAKILICGRRAEPLADAEARLRAQNIDVASITCDIREDADIAKLIDFAREKFGKLSILINNAGGQFPSPAEHISPKGFDAVIRNNLSGTWRITHAVANAFFIPQRRGRIVNMIANVVRGFPGMSHTGAARAGVDNLTKSLAVEWARHGIRVNAVAPGIIVTSGTKQYPPELLEAGEKANPFRRLGSAEEVSHLMVYLALPQADYVTGQTVYIDGGASLWGSIWELPAEAPNYAPYPIPKRD